MIKFNILFFIWTLAYISVVEYLIHRRAMHAYLPFPYLKQIGIEHRNHHRGNNHIEVTTIDPLKQLSIISPILLIFAYFNLYSYLFILCITITVYCLYWNDLHAAFHGTGGSWCKKIPWYHYQCRHHLIHHKHPKYNYSGIFAPVLDVLCRTKFNEHTSKSVRTGETI